MHILLVKPARQSSVEGSKPFSGANLRPGGLLPLGISTVAALTPKKHTVDIWDENVQGKIGPGSRQPRNYDIVGVTGIDDCERMIALADILRERGLMTVAGGVGVTSGPERYREHFDVLIIGEAEYIWPRFLEDFERGEHQAQYRQVSKVDMNDSPPPVWDQFRANIDRYSSGAVQTTRGCPFDCEYCDVIHLFGRTPRHKSIKQVLDEIQTLEQLGVGCIFLCDDNLYGDPRYAKALLRAIAELNDSFRAPLLYFTQISINIADDDEMLELLSGANVSHLVIGIETPNQKSLVEANKLHNTRLDMVRAVKKIQSYGLTVQANMMVGFDHDGPDIFDQQFEFLQAAGLPKLNVNIVGAFPGTRQWARLHKERRFVWQRNKTPESEGALIPTNVIPKLMTLEQLVRGYRGLLERLFAWDNWERRMKVFLDNIERFPAAMPRVSRRKLLPSPWRLARAFLLSPSGWRDIYRFLNDKEAHAARARLKAQVENRDQLLKRVIGEYFMQQYYEMSYVLPGRLRGLDAAIESIVAAELPEPIEEA